MTLPCEKRWRDKNREKVRQQTNAGFRRHVKRTKLKVLAHYSHGIVQCTSCGIKDARVLSIDHVDGNGNKHRDELLKKYGGKTFSGYRFYKWLIHNNYPEGYQVLCMNCQFIKRYDREWQSLDGLNRLI